MIILVIIVVVVLVKSASTRIVSLRDLASRRTRILCATCLGAWLLGGGDGGAAEPNWGAAASSYVVVDQDLRAVLAEISHHLSLSAHISDEIKGRVREKMTFPSDKDLIENLASRYGFTWYYDGSGIYFSSLKENVSQIFPVGQVSVSYLQQELEDLAILDPRFELRYSESGRIVYVSGPPRYVEVVRQALEAANAQTVMKLQSRSINVIYGFGENH